MKVAEQLTLNGKTVVLTGATGILGRHFAEAFVQAGADVALIDQQQKSLDELAYNLEKEYRKKVKGYQCDLTSEDEVSSVIKNIENDFKHIDVLHNNAASKSSNLDHFFQDFEDFPYETWKQVMSVNVDGMFLTAKHVGRHMIQNNINGSIIQTASIYGVVAPDQRIYEGSFYMDRKISSPAVYSASKAAVIGLTKYLAAYWGQKGIRVNSITPGGIESGQNEIFKNKYSARVPMGRMGKADELTGALIFLASEGSSYMTGHNLIIDGGLSTW